MATVPSGPGPEAHFFGALREGRFVIQRCTACGKAVFFPRVGCPHCGATDLIWFSPSGTGTVYSTGVVRQPPTEGPPYNVALVDLDEGVRMMSRVVVDDPASVRIGDRVQARIEPGEPMPFVVFDPISGARP